MAEYIVEYPDDLVAEGYVEECINVHERIVRCKDWKHYEYFANIDFYDCTRQVPSVKPDGFCAWGERRGDD